MHFLRVLPHQASAARGTRQTVPRLCPPPRRSAAALARLRQLRTLDMSLCGKLDDACLAALAAAPALADLDVRGCWQLSPIGGWVGCLAWGMHPPAVPEFPCFVLHCCWRGGLYSGHDLPTAVRAPCAGVRALLASSGSLLSLNVEACHRLFGEPAAVPPGFAAQQVARPGVITRLPPGEAQPEATCGTAATASAMVEGQLQRALAVPVMVASG